MTQTENGSQAPDRFDRTYEILHDLPDVVLSKESIVTQHPKLGVGGAETFIIQTIRHRENGDSVFLQCSSASGHIRMVLPPKVSDAIARQREALSTKLRRKLGRERAERDKVAGIQPGFMKNPGKGGRRKKGRA